MRNGKSKGRETTKAPSLSEFSFFDVAAANQAGSLFSGGGDRVFSVLAIFSPDRPPSRFFVFFFSSKTRASLSKVMTPA